MGATPAAAATSARVTLSRGLRSGTPITSLRTLIRLNGPIATGGQTPGQELEQVEDARHKNSVLRALREAPLRVEWRTMLNSPRTVLKPPLLRAKHLPTFLLTVVTGIMQTSSRIEGASRAYVEAREISPVPRP